MTLEEEEHEQGTAETQPGNTRTQTYSPCSCLGNPYNRRRPHCTWPHKERSVVPDSHRMAANHRQMHQQEPWCMEAAHPVPRCRSRHGCPPKRLSRRAAAPSPAPAGARRSTWRPPVRAGLLPSAARLRARGHRKVTNSAERSRTLPKGHELFTSAGLYTQRFTAIDLYV